MPRQRGYLSSCGISHALDLVGERWALPIVRELVHGPRRFSDLRRELPGASPNALSDRLRELAESGVLRRRQLPAPSGSWVYELTDWGAELGPLLVSLGDWGVRSGRLDPHAPLSLGSLMLLFRTYYRGEQRGTIGVRLVDDVGTQAFGVQLTGGAGVTSHGAPQQPHAIIEGTARALVDALGPRGDTSGVAISGDEDLARAFLRDTRVSEPGQAPVLETRVGS
jgi:DNA-binding HxlR family transcriptional regulator